MSHTLTTVPPVDMNAHYWQSSCEYEMKLCEELMGRTYDQFILLTDSDFANSLSWKEIKTRLMRMRAYFIELKKQATPEQCLIRFMEDLPDGYLD